MRETNLRYQTRPRATTEQTDKCNAKGLQVYQTPYLLRTRARTFEKVHVE